MAPVLRAARALALAATVMPAAPLSLAGEPAHTMQSPAERASERAAAHAPGVWQGNWRVLRDDPRIRTRAGAELLRLHVLHHIGDTHAQVQWVAGRAICDDPLGEPCEWIGAQGTVTHATVAPGGLYAVLAVSADETQPFVLHLQPPADRGDALLFDASGDLRFIGTFVETDAP